MDTRAQSSPESSRAPARQLDSFSATARRNAGPGRSENTIVIEGIGLVADLSGALYWPEEGILAVADLHLEKGSALAVHGELLPPYDTASTLERLAWVVAFYDPRIVVALGDSFHDGGGAARLGDADRAALGSLQGGRDWVWVAGNHDHVPIRGVGGEFVRSINCGKLQFRHEPRTDRYRGEIAGHLHPSARLNQRGRTLRRRCFAANDHRVVLPAFGAYTGGLSIRHPAFCKVFRGLAFTAHLIGDHDIFPLPAMRCLAD